MTENQMRVLEDLCSYPKGKGEVDGSDIRVAGTLIRTGLATKISDGVYAVTGDGRAALKKAKKALVASAK